MMLYLALKRSVTLNREVTSKVLDWREEQEKLKSCTDEAPSQTIDQEEHAKLLTEVSIVASILDTGTFTEGVLRTIIYGIHGEIYNIGNDSTELSLNKLVSIVKNIYNDK